MCKHLGIFVNYTCFYEKRCTRNLRLKQTKHFWLKNHVFGLGFHYFCQELANLMASGGHFVPLIATTEYLYIFLHCNYTVLNQCFSIIFCKAPAHQGKENILGPQLAINKIIIYKYFTSVPVPRSHTHSIYHHVKPQEHTLNYLRNAVPNWNYFMMPFDLQLKKVNNTLLYIDYKIMVESS